MNKHLSAGNDSSGVWYGVLAYTAWGVLPLYWKMLKMVPAPEILAHRILWSFVFVGGLLVACGKRRSLFNAFRNPRTAALILAGSVLISINWFTYIWAVNSNKIIEASMGYYINPLVAVLLGVAVLKEKLTRWHITAIFFAATGVVIMTVQYGQFPKIALILACSFGLYGLCKKLTRLDSVTGIVLETMLVMPVALIYILNKELHGTGAFGRLPLLYVAVLVGSGIATATPLLWFALGAQRIKLSTLGFLQYIAPTISLFIGVFLYQEVFSMTHFISFSFIWAGLAIFILTNTGILFHGAEKHTAAVEQRMN